MVVRIAETSAVISGTNPCHRKPRKRQTFLPYNPSGMLQPIMFKLWKLNWLLWRAQRSWGKQYKKLEKKKASRDEFQQLDHEEYFATQGSEKEIDRFMGNRLFHDAHRLAVEAPPL